MIDRGSGAVREFALFGETTGEIDEFGLPVHADWTADDRGSTTVVYGHTPCNVDDFFFSGQLNAVSLPPKTQPVSMQSVLLTQSACTTGRGHQANTVA